MDLCIGISLIVYLFAVVRHAAARSASPSARVGMGKAVRRRLVTGSVQKCGVYGGGSCPIKVI